MQAGDIIVAIDDHEIEDMIDVTKYTQENIGTPTDVTLERGDERVTVTLTPRENPPEGEGSMGVLIGAVENPNRLQTYSLGEAIQQGTNYVVRIATLTFSLPVQVLRGAVSMEEARPVGIVGISRIAGASMETSIERGALYPILTLIALSQRQLGDLQPAAHPRLRRRAHPLLPDRDNPPGAADASAPGKNSHDHDDVARAPLRRHHRDGHYRAHRRARHLIVITSDHRLPDRGVTQI